MKRIGRNCGVNNMSFIKRLEKNIAKIEKSIAKEKKKIEDLRVKCEAHKITRAEFNIKKKKIEEIIRNMDSRLRVLRGGIAKEKRYQEEKAEEKKKKKEEKEKKK